MFCGSYLLNGTSPYARSEGELQNGFGERAALAFFRFWNRWIILGHPTKTLKRFQLLSPETTMTFPPSLQRLLFRQQREGFWTRDKAMALQKNYPS